jgi:primosomal protein N' (replication factor Y)
VEIVRIDPTSAGAPGSKPHGPLMPAPPASPDQARAIAAVEAEIATRHFHVFLLLGVTGSGKTDVYLAATRAALAAGQSVLMLIPEIGLTHEIAERARARLGGRVALLHSALAPRERWAEWARIRRGEATVVVGPRSAVFAPLSRLGLVVVDEEHDPSYKQEESVRYNGRDLAVVRARLAGCPVVLGSATPSLESFNHSTTGRYTLLELRERATGCGLPAVALLDLRSPGGASQRGMCSEELQAAIASNNAQHGQSLIFLNRRGFAHFVHCLACGEPVGCPACSVTLTLHRARHALVCHHCGATRAASLPCDHCGSRAAHGRTPGTEQIEADLVRRFPELRVARMDRDSVGRRGAHARLLRAWHAGEIDVLIGTQMVTKGVDNPRVTLVGVLNADISLNLPDFRAAERTFQLVSQVAGRAGRGEAPGVVLVQTLRPNHYSLRSAAAHDYRRDDIEVLGPAPAPIERLRGWYRWQVLVRGTESATMRALLEHGLAEVAGQRQARRVRVVVDVDPYSML